MTKTCEIKTALGERDVTITSFTYSVDREGVCGLIPAGTIIEDITHNLNRELTEQEREQLEQVCFDHL